MTNERVFFEINENNCRVEEGKMAIIIPPDIQSCDGIDFYFAPSFIEKHPVKINSVTITPMYLKSFWNWFMLESGIGNYFSKSDTPIDISDYRNPGIWGSFGFSGYTTDKADITITFDVL